MTLWERVKGKLIVSCQALPGNPLRDSDSIARLAEAAALGGAAAIRANGVDDLAAIRRRRVDAPLIGINKEPPSAEHPYITPTFEHAAAIARLGVDIIALDATDRPRAGGVGAGELIARVRAELGVPVMADVATFEEGVAAARAGADCVATTLSGFVGGGAPPDTPDLELVRRLAETLAVPVVAEGRYKTPADVDAAFACGAHAVVVGKMITNPMFITRRFIAQIERLAARRGMGTEDINPDTLDLDRLDTFAMLARLNREDEMVPGVLRLALPARAVVVDGVYERLARGGRLIYVGAGTSGRLAIQDAAECPPTYGVPPEMVRAVIAGGDGAVTRPVEKAEDNETEGALAMARLELSADDVTLGLSASGNAPFVRGALAEARRRGAATAAIACNANAAILADADWPVLLASGPEAVCGSTRMKAGTAQKIALNMISTAVMVKLGRVRGNLMVRMRPVNSKLQKRALAIVGRLAGVDERRAQALLDAAGGDIDRAVAMNEERTSDVSPL